MLLKVQYWNHGEGLVDDLTLNQLIASKEIKALYRPAEDNWVEVRQLALRNGSNGSKRRRRLLDRDAKPEPVKKAGLFSRIFQNGKNTEQAGLSAKDLFKLGYFAFFSSGDHHEAARCMTKVIQADPSLGRAYLVRGMSYEALGNFHQSILDFNRYIDYAPDDSRGFYLRGLARLKSEDLDEAKADLETAAAMGHGPAADLLKGDVLNRTDQN